MSILVAKKEDGVSFYDAMKKALSNNKRAQFVDLKTAEEYSSMNYLLLIDDGLAGIAITQTNEIVSIFKDQVNPLKNAIDILLPLAVINGGTHMNCYGDFLAKQYMKNGFVPIARCKFDRACAVPTWDYERDGEPDIYFLVRFTSNLDALVKECSNFDSSYFDYLKSSLPYMDYESGLEYAEKMVDKISFHNNLSYYGVIQSVALGTLDNVSEVNTL